MSSLLVGEIAVRVTLQGDDFARQLVSAMQLAVRSANSELAQLGADVKPISLAIDDAAAKAAIGDLGKGTETVITPIVDSAAASGLLDALGNPISTVVTPLVDGQRAMAEIGDLSKSWEATMTVIVDDAAARAARADLAEPIEPVLIPQTDTGGAAGGAARSGGGGGGAGGLAAVPALGAIGGGSLLTAAGIAAMVKSGAEYESVLTRIRTVATVMPEDAIKNADALEKLRGVVTGLGNDLNLPGQSASDAAAAIDVLVRANYSLGDAEALARSALQLSIVTRTDAAASTVMLTDMMASSGLAAGEAQFAIDRLSMAEVLGKGSVADLAESVKYSGTGFKALYGDTMTSKQGFESLVGTLLVFDQAGVRGSLAGTMLNRMMTDFATPTGKAQKILDELTGSLNEANPALLAGGSITRDAAGTMRPIPDIIKNMSEATKGMGKEQREATEAAILTTNGLRAFQIMTSQGADATEKFTAKLHEADGAGQKLADGAAGPMSKGIENLGSTLKTTANDLVLAFGPSISTALTTVTDAIGTVGPALVPVAEALGQFAAAVLPIIGPVISFAAEVEKWTLLHLVVPLIQQMTDGVNALSGAVSAVIGFFAALKWSDVTGALGVAVDEIVGYVTSIPGRIAHIAGEMLQKGTEFVKGLLDGVQTFFLGTFGPWVATIPTKAKDFVGDVATTLLEKGRGLVTGLWNGTKAVWEDVTGWLGSLPGKATSAVPSMLTTILEQGRSIITGLWNGAKVIWTDTVGWLTGLPGKVMAAVPSMLGTLADEGRSIIQGLWNGAKAKWDEFYAWLTSLPGKVGSALSSIPGKIGSFLDPRSHFADGGIVYAATPALIGEAGPEVVLPLTRPDRMRTLLSNSYVSAAITAAMPASDAALIGEIRRMRSAIGAVPPSTTYVEVGHEGMARIYAREHAAEQMRRLHLMGVGR